MEVIAMSCFRPQRFSDHFSAQFVANLIPFKQGVPPMEQRLNVLENKQISSEAYQLSIGYQLGTPQDELKVSVTIKRILGGIVCLVFYPIIFGSWRIYICSEGFVYKRGMKIDVFRW